MTRKDNRADRFAWKPGHVEIVSHTDPKIEKKLKEKQEKAQKK